MEENYLLLRNFLSFKQATSIGNEMLDFHKKYRCQIDSDGRPYVKDFVPCLELLCLQTPILSELYGETLLPSASFTRIYYNGQSLKRHVDKDCCEIGITTHLIGDSGWPIWVKDKDGKEVAFELDRGDAVLYKGYKAQHWREPYKGQEYVQVFNHYVRSRGPKGHQYFYNKGDSATWQKWIQRYNRWKTT